MVLYFFDKKSYLLMAFMMTFGILLRSSRLVPPLWLGTFTRGWAPLSWGRDCGFSSSFSGRRAPFTARRRPGMTEG